MPEDGQRGPGSGGTAHRGPPGAGQARQDAGGESPPGDGQDHVGTPRPDALIPALDEDQVAALREWDRVSAGRQVWRQAPPADPSLGEYPEASEVRPGLFTRFVPVAGRDGQLPPIQTTSVSETPPTPLGRAGQVLKRLAFGPPLDATAIAVERMRKLVALAVLSADALSSVVGHWRFSALGGSDRERSPSASAAASSISSSTSSVPAGSPDARCRRHPGSSRSSSVLPIAAHSWQPPHRMPVPPACCAPSSSGPVAAP